MCPKIRIGLSCRMPARSVSMKDLSPIARHYTQGNLLHTIRSAVAQLGKEPEFVTIDDLAPVDEFHIGGRTATRDFLSQLAPKVDDHLLDIGCGIGGASRYAALTYNCRVSGIDLTEEFVATGRELCRWTGLSDRITLTQGSALALDFAAGTFDKAYMLHVGMNIADKAALAIEVARVLKPGALFGIYDVMRMSDEPLAYPVPWASTEAHSFPGTPEDYRAALQAAGFEIVAMRNRRDFAINFFEGLREKAVQADTPIGLPLTMGATAQTKIRNMIENLTRGCIAPVELIARKS